MTVRVPLSFIENRGCNAQPISCMLLAVVMAAQELGTIIRSLFADFERHWLGITGPTARQSVHSAIASDAENAASITPDTLTYCPQCGITVGTGEADPKTGCANCRSNRFPWTRLYRLGSYQGELRECIHQLKFHRWESIGIELGRSLSNVLLANGVEADCVVPLPTSLGRRIRRGVDHTHIVAQSLAHEMKLPLVQPLRRREHKPQRTVPPSQRRDNVRHTFAVRRFPPRIRHRDLSEWTCILVDDIATTRSTLITAARYLRKRCGVKRVVVAVLAVAEPRTRIHSNQAEAQAKSESAQS